MRGQIRTPNSPEETQKTENQISNWFCEVKVDVLHLILAKIKENEPKFPNKGFHSEDSQLINLSRSL